MFALTAWEQRRSLDGTTASSLLGADGHPAEEAHPARRAVDPRRDCRGDTEELKRRLGPVVAVVAEDVVVVAALGLHARRSAWAARASARGGRGGARAQRQPRRRLRVEGWVPREPKRLPRNRRSRRCTRCRAPRYPVIYAKAHVVRARVARRQVVQREPHARPRALLVRIAKVRRRRGVRRRAHFVGHCLEEVGARTRPRARRPPARRRRLGELSLDLRRRLLLGMVAARHPARRAHVVRFGDVRRVPIAPHEPGVAVRACDVVGRRVGAEKPAALPLREQPIVRRAAGALVGRRGWGGVPEADDRRVRVGVVGVRSVWVVLRRLRDGESIAL